MKISFISTVFNEGKAVNGFIASLLSQTRMPDEIIIVDGGSRDRTVANIKNQISKIKYQKVQIRILVKTGNRAVGRNEAIKNARNEIIVCSDAGCILDKDWIKNISEPFRSPNIDVVSGYYKPITNNVFEKCLSTYTCVMLDRLDPNKFLPSSRSIAFRKSVWQKIGRYPENLDTCEDLVFASRLKKDGYKFSFAKNAVVKWIQKKNLEEAFFQFFNYAKGDGMARYFRLTTPFLFGRYVIGFYFLLLFFIMKSSVLLYLIIFGFFIYLTWSIFKNYRYVKNIKAFLFLPLLQMTSDIAVLLGTTLGMIMSISMRSIVSVVKNNKMIVILIMLYVGCMVLFANWGIPSSKHPFNYFMDEWHQAQSVRNVFSQGSPNVSGSANGSMFHFFLSGIYLVPFILIGILNPFAIKSSIDSLEMQQKLFEVLRLNTMLFGVLSIILIAYIAKKYFKLNPFLTTFLFVVNPIFLTLSNYFKYDIALIFWIILSFLFFLKYSLKPNTANFFLSAFFSGIAFSVKVSAIPFLPILISVFLLFNPDRRKYLVKLIGGLLIFFFTFLLFGIPDLLLGKGNIVEYLYDNLIRTPSYGQNYILGMSYWIYIAIKGIPSVFGIFLSLVSIFGLVFIIKRIFKNKPVDLKRNLYVAIFIMLVFFVASLILLRIEARGNRLLVLLPFMALLGGLFIDRVLKTYSEILRITLTIVFAASLLFQTAESLSWLYVKLQADPRQKSSEWIINNIPAKSILGIENIPIYQFLPDIVLKEFYIKEYNPEKIGAFNYKMIDDLEAENFPEYIIVTNEKIATDYFKDSFKKSLINKLREEEYRKIFTASPDFYFLNLFRDERDYYMSGLIQSPVSISIYKKTSR